MWVRDLFEVWKTPRIAGGKVPVLVHAQAANQRAWQMTRDLESFWRSGYARMRKDLAWRDPKHPRRRIRERRDQLRMAGLIPCCGRGEDGFSWGVARLLIIIALLTLIAAWVARWWFWKRVRDKGRRVECSMTVSELYEKLGQPRKKPNDLRDAAALGSALRDCGLRLLEQDGLAVAKKRRTGWWSLKILPILVAVIFVFSLVFQRVAPAWIMAIGLLIIALHVALRVTGLGIELKAVRRGLDEFEKKGRFRRMSEEEAVVDCAKASVWETILPW